MHIIYIQTIPVEQFTKQSDQRDLQIRIRVSVHPVIRLDDDVTLLLQVPRERLVLSRRNVQRQPRWIESATPIIR